MNQDPNRVFFFSRFESGSKHFPPDPQPWLKLTEECPCVPGEGERVLDGYERPDHEDGEVPHHAENAVLPSTTHRSK